MRWQRLVRGAGAVALAVGAGIACGGDDGRFDEHVAEVRAAVDDGDHARASRALEDLAIDALAAHDDGTISDAELDEVVSLIDASQALVDELAPPPTSTTVAPTTTEAPPATVEEQQEGPPGEGRGQGRGNDKDDKDDKDKDDDNDDDKDDEDDD